MIETKKDGTIQEHKLIIGTAKFPVGELKFKGHRPYEIPKTITVSRHNGEWHVSFNYVEVLSPGTQEPLSEGDLLAYFLSLTPEELDSITVDGDRGVAIPMAISNGIDYDFTETEKQLLAKAVKSRKKLQKRMSRQQPGSKRRSVTRDKIGQTYTKQRNIRQDRAQ